MKTSFKIVILSLLVGNYSLCQNQPNLAVNSATYHTAIGLRAGGTSGLTIKQFIGGNSALEAIIGLWSHGFSGTLLYEMHAGTTFSGLNWYYGAGGHVAFDTGHDVHFRGNSYYNDYRNDEFGLGIDGIIGLEYKIPPIPFAISIDMKPLLEFTSGGDIWMALDPSIGIKVTF